LVIDLDLGEAHQYLGHKTILHQGISLIKEIMEKIGIIAKWNLFVKGELTSW